MATLYTSGLSGSQVGTALGVSYGRVHQILREEGVPTRKPPSSPKPPKPPKEPRPRVVDKVLAFLAEHPSSSVEEVTEGIGHGNQGTVGQLLSRLKAQGLVVRNDEFKVRGVSALWALPTSH